MLKLTINNILASFLLAILFLASTFLVLPNHSQSHAQGILQKKGILKTEAPKATVELISDVVGVGNVKEFELGVWFKIESGWKVYWRSPGYAETISPPELHWDRSENIEVSEIHWPYPHRFVTFGIHTLGYSNEVVLPVTATIKEPGKPIKAKLDMEFIVCSDDTCIYKDEQLSLELPALDADPSEHTDLIAHFNKQVPRGEANHAYLSLEPVQLSPHSVVPPVLTITAHHTKWFADPDIFIEGPQGYFFDRPKVSLSNDNKTAKFEIEIYRDNNKVPTPLPNIPNKQVTLTLVDGESSIEATRLMTAGEVGFGEFLVLLVIAFLGGLILNLMPCVLPVISIKILAIIEDSGAAITTIRKDFFATTLGILLSFFILALIAVFLKVFGVAVGWGMHFQQPFFIIGIAILMVFFACNLWSLFEINVPAGIAEIATAYQPKHQFMQHFYTGILATLLATPCSAPFVGTAISFALSREVFEIILIFLMMGVGLAFPYILLIIYPGFESRLPRPGHWMLTLKHLLSIFLAITVLWLMWVLAMQRGPLLALIISALLIVMSIIFVIRYAFKMSRTINWVGTVLVIAGCILATLKFSTDAAVIKESEIWVPFDKAKIAREVEKGNIVFVDVTAQWCLTCKVNKSMVVYRDAVMDHINRTDVIAMQLDWTNPNPEVDAYLNSFGRFGIPLNVVYSKNYPEGYVLPELLTVGKVLEAFERADEVRKLPVIPIQNRP